MAYGMTSYLGVAKQPAVGTLATTNFTYFEFTSESVTEKIPQLVSGGMRMLYDMGDNYAGPREISGDVDVENRNLDVGIMLHMMFGAPLSTTAPGNGEFVHTFVPQQTDASVMHAKEPWSIRKKSAQEAVQSEYGDMFASAFEMSWANGDFVTSKLSVMGGSDINVGSTVAVTPTFNGGRKSTWSSTSVVVDGNADCDFREITLTIDDAMELQHTLCDTVWPSHAKRTDFRSITLGGTVVFNTRAHYDKFIAQTEHTLMIHTEGVDLAGTAGSGNQSITVNVPGFRFTEFPDEVGGAGSLEISFSAEAKYDSVTANRALDVIVANNVNTYS